MHKPWATARCISRSCNSHCSYYCIASVFKSQQEAQYYLPTLSGVQVARKTKQTIRWGLTGSIVIVCMSWECVCLCLCHVCAWINNSTRLISALHSLICGRLFTAASVSIVSRWNSKGSRLQGGGSHKWVWTPKTAAGRMSARGIVLFTQACSSLHTCLSVALYSTADVWPHWKLFTVKLTVTYRQQLSSSCSHCGNIIIKHCWSLNAIYVYFICKW